jgi:hypothetical protein
VFIRPLEVTRNLREGATVARHEDLNRDVPGITARGDGGRPAPPAILGHLVVVDTDGVKAPAGRVRRAVAAVVSRVEPDVLELTEIVAGGDTGVSMMESAVRHEEALAAGRVARPEMGVGVRR